MPLDPALPDDLGAGRLNDLERRIEQLERVNSLLSSTITGGRLTILDPDAAEVFVAGRYTSVYEASGGAGPTDGIRVKAPHLLDEWGGDPSEFVPTVLEANNADGWCYPRLHMGWRPEWNWSGGIAPMAKHTSPGNWFGYFASKVFTIPSRSIRTTFYIAGSASTTWEIRLYGAYGSGADPVGMTPYAITDADGHAINAYWEPTSLHPGIGSWNLWIQLRRTSGTGTALLYWPEMVAWGAPIELPDGNAGVMQHYGTFTP